MQPIPERERTAPSALATVWRNTHLRNISLARFASVSGRWAATVALSVVAYQKGGAQSVGLLGVCRILPAAFAGPLATKLLGRFRSDRLLLVAGLARSCAIAAAGLLLLDDTGLDHTGLAPVFVLVGLESLVSTMVRPLQTAALPFLARVPSELTAANLTLTTIEGSGMLVGPLLSGALLSLWSSGPVLLATAASYALSTVLIARIPPWESSVLRNAGGDTFDSTLAGFRAVHADKRLRLVVGLYCVENLVSGAVNVLVVVTAIDLLALGSSGVGLLNGAIGAGGLAGALVIARLLGRRRIASDLGIGLVLCGVPVILVALAPDTAVTLVLLAVLGVGVTIVDFTAVTLLHRTIPDDVLARAFSLLQSVFVAMLGLGAFIAPSLVSWLGTRTALIVTGSVLPLLTAVNVRRLTTLDAGYVETDHLVELLVRIPIFTPLDLPTLERLARSLHPIHAEPGTVVIPQGAAGDLYYAIEAGELLVTVDGEAVRTLHAGDGFGEIALLRDVPRTSTVTAIGAVRLLALEREEFLDAVGGNPSATEAANAVIDMRLGTLRAGLASH